MLLSFLLVTVMGPDTSIGTDATDTLRGAKLFDALTSVRPYRVALTDEDAGKYLVRQAQIGKFSRRHVEAFLDTIGNGEICLAS